MIDLTSLVRPGHGIWWGQGAAEPTPLVDALLDQVGQIGPVSAFCGLTLNERLTRELPELLTVFSYGALGELRRLSRVGRLEVLPCHYSAIPRMFERGQLPHDVGFLQVSPPDADGMVTLGLGVEYTADALPHASVLVAEVNHRMPRTVGGPRIPLSAFAAHVETDRPLLESPQRGADAVDARIAEHVASVVDDGDTLQMGVGPLPNAIMEALSGHADLGVHSGLVTDGVLRLVEKGVVTGARKEVDPGVVVTGAALGSTWLYDNVAEFGVRFRPCSYTHSPSVLSRLGSLVSINSAIEVDLYGQVGAEMRGDVHIGAVGGQVDFSRAASLTGARSVIALRSESRGASTIVPRLGSGLVTTARVDVDVVVTEHGVARLTGTTATERARRLVEVAAPQHREALDRALAEEESA